MGPGTVQRYPMNPTDCLFHAFEHLLRSAGYTGAATFMVLEAAGELAPDAVREALGRALAAHPVTLAAAAVSRWRARPQWVAQAVAGPPAYTFTDLSAAPDWTATADALATERLSSGWDTACPPQVRLDHYRGPGAAQRLCLRWPHALMDAEGAQYLLAEMDRLGGPAPGPPPEALLPDDAVVDPLAPMPPWRRWRLLWRALRDRTPHPRGQDTALSMSLPGRPADSRRLRYLLRAWSAEATAALRARARALVPAGPALYSRYLAGCVLRAVHRLHAEHGRRLPCGALMFPLRLPGLARRPLRGNYLVATTLAVPLDVLADPRALAAAVARQLEEYARRDGPLASWALQRLTAQLRVGQYRRLIRWETDRQPFVTGFSLYGEIEPPLRTFLGAQVTNLYGGGVISIPPAWNVTFSRFAERMNLVIAWPEAAFPPAVVTRYADLIEEEALAG